MIYYYTHYISIIYDMLYILYIIWVDCLLGLARLPEAGGLRTEGAQPPLKRAF